MYAEKCRGLGKEKADSPKLCQGHETDLERLDTQSVQQSGFEHQDKSTTCRKKMRKRAGIDLLGMSWATASAFMRKLQRELNVSKMSTSFSSAALANQAGLSSDLDDLKLQMRQLASSGT